MPNEIAVREVEGEWVSAEEENKVNIRGRLGGQSGYSSTLDEMLELQRTNSISGMPNMPEHIRKILCSEAR